tara:strand:- start:701 stop:1675 length:975 start_codon:yes stop_codon:yes gene_type:complete
MKKHLFTIFTNETIKSIIITICLLALITFLVYFCHCEYKKTIQEGLKYYGEETTSVNGTLPYKSTMIDIKYPSTTTNSDIYDLMDAEQSYNSNLFNKEEMNMHFSDETVMKDIKYFNNATNLMLENYLNDNIPDTTTEYIQNIGGSNSLDNDYKVFIENEISGTYYDTIYYDKGESNRSSTMLYDYKAETGRDISNVKINIYRFIDNTGLSEEDKYDPISGEEPTNGIYEYINDIKVNNTERTDKIYNYDGVDLDYISYDEIYDQLINYESSKFSSDVSMTNPGKYSSHYFESNYADLSYNIKRDFKYFYSVAPTIGYHKKIIQ